MGTYQQPPASNDKRVPQEALAHHLLIGTAVQPSNKGRPTGVIQGKPIRHHRQFLPWIRGLQFPQQPSLPIHHFTLFCGYTIETLLDGRLQPLGCNNLMSQGNQLIANCYPFALKFLFLVLQAVELGIGEGAPALNVLSHTAGTPCIALTDYADAVRFEALRTGSHGRDPEDFDFGSKTTALFSFGEGARLRHD